MLCKGRGLADDLAGVEDAKERAQTLGYLMLFLRYEAYFNVPYLCHYSTCDHKLAWAQRTSVLAFNLRRWSTNRTPNHNHVLRADRGTYYTRVVQKDYGISAPEPHLPRPHEEESS